jgi:hypothetical protein
LQKHLFDWQPQPFLLRQRVEIQVPNGGWRPAIIVGKELATIEAAPDCIGAVRLTRDLQIRPRSEPAALDLVDPQNGSVLKVREADGAFYWYVILAHVQPAAPWAIVTGQDLALLVKTLRELLKKEGKPEWKFSLRSSDATFARATSDELPLLLQLVTSRETESSVDTFCDRFDELLKNLDFSAGKVNFRDPHGVTFVTDKDKWITHGNIEAALREAQKPPHET